MSERFTVIARRVSRAVACVGLGIGLVAAGPVCHAQTAPGFVWSASTGLEDQPFGISFDAQGHVRVVSHISSMIYTRGYDTNGHLLQSATSTNQASFLGAAVDSSGNVLATGAYSQNTRIGSITLPNVPIQSMFIAKLGASGLPQWVKTSSGGYGTIGWGACADNSGNAFVCGEFTGTSTSPVVIGSASLVNYASGMPDGFVAKYDTTGKALWARRFGGGAVRRVMASTTDKSGNVYLASGALGSFGAVQMVTKYDPAGTPLWTRQSQGVFANGNAVAADPSGNVYVAGTIHGTNTFRTTTIWAPDDNVLLTKYDSAGNLLWVRQTGGTNLDGALSVTTDALGNAYLVGIFTDSTIIGKTPLTELGRGYFIAKCTAAGEFVWAMATAGQLTHIVAGKDNEVYMTDLGGANGSTRVARIGLVPAPSITAQPTNQSIRPGADALLTVEATPASSLDYQWYRGMSGNTNAPVFGAVSNFCKLSGLYQSASFWVRVSNLAGSVDSQTATVTILSPPAIPSWVAFADVGRGQSATLSVTATGSDPLYYQWYQGSSGDVSTPVAGATSNVCITPLLSITTPFWVQVTNAAGAVSSPTVTVAVSDAPTITQQPQSVTISPGQSAQLSVVATGSYALRIYQWYIGESGDMSNPVATNVLNTYTTPPLTSTTRYWVLVRNAIGEAKSETAVVTVLSPQPAFKVLGCAGGMLTLQVTGIPGTRWQFEASGDLLHWQAAPELTPVTLGTTGATNLQAQVQSGKTIFYRAAVAH